MARQANPVALSWSGGKDSALADPDRLDPAFVGRSFDEALPVTSGPGRWRR